MMTMTPTTAAAQRPDAAVAVKPRSTAGVWWRAYRHHLRLVRNASIAWITALTVISVGVVATFEDRIGTEAEMEALAALEDIPAFEALSGRYVDITSAEGFVLSRWGMFAILVAVWAMLAAVRLLRRAEEAGHTEPLRAGALSPRGLLAAALAALFTVYALFAVAIGTTHTAVGMDPATAWALGGAVALLAATFAAAGALASQVVATRRRAAGLVGAFLGLALGVRLLAAASTTPDWVWWATPFGWMGYLHALDDARVAVVAAFAGLLAVLVATAFTLARRDLHAGLVGGAEQTATRTRPVRSQTGLAARLTAGATAMWAAVIGILALAFGLFSHDFAEAVAEFPTQAELMAELFGMVIHTVEGNVALAFFFAALLLAVVGAGQAAAIREEEATWRIEHLLARPVGRTRWLATRALVATAALVVIAVVAGLLGWVGTAITGEAIAVGDALRAGVNVVPIGVLALGIGIAVLGLAPRLTAPLTYGLVVAAFVLDFVGPFLDPPEWVLDLSPFRHLAAVPAVEANVGAALVMLAVGILGAALGLAAFRRRDLQEA